MPASAIPARASEATAHEPEATAREPEATAREPEATGREPEATARASAVPTGDLIDGLTGHLVDGGGGRRWWHTIFSCMYTYRQKDKDNG